MSTPPSNRPPEEQLSRIDELLADRAVFGLDTDEEAELQDLLDRQPEQSTEAFDLAAAALWLAQGSASEPMPEGLRDMVADQIAPVQPRPSSPDPLSKVTGPKVGGWTGALLAVAASLLIGLWLGSPAAEPTIDLADARATLTQQSGVTLVAWSATDDPSAVGVAQEDRAEADWGDVVWSDSDQQGYMRFRGLAANDPTVEQYQLWIFDSARDDAHPVDGGVFDIEENGDGEQIVPIQAKLPVSKAVMFAITVERPGGVVVSDRSRLPLLAK